MPAMNTNYPCSGAGQSSGCAPSVVSDSPPMSGIASGSGVARPWYEQLVCCVSHGVQIVMAKLPVALCLGGAVYSAVPHLDQPDIDRQPVVQQVRPTSPAAMVNPC